MAEATSTTQATLPDGEVAVEPPYLALDRPFSLDHEVAASRYYPYGTTAGGAYLLHHGIDIGNPVGTPVLAIADGTVVFAGRDDAKPWGPETDFYGQLVVLRHEGLLQGRPLFSLYGHVSRVLVEARQRVAAGEAIAEVGAEGIALGPHLHLEIRTVARDYGATANPELFLGLLPGTAVIAGRVLAADGTLAPGVPVSLYTLAGGGPGDWLTGTTTYPASSVNRSPDWGETFVFGDVEEGAYWLAADLGGIAAGRAVTVTAGSAHFATLSPDP